MSLTVAAPAEEPVEYVLLPNYKLVERADYDGELAKKVEVRREGENTDRWMTGVSQASLLVFEPEGEPTAAAVVCPGGGYYGLSYDKEGTYVAKWLAERGIAAGVLRYSTSTGKPLGKQPLSEAQYAIRVMKEKYGEKVGIVGFSAGGHLAATAATITVPADASNESTPIARQNSRPAFQALIYAVITLDKGVTHGGSAKNLLGDSPSAEAVAELSADKHVTSETPPAFLATTADDRAVPYENSVRYLNSCKAAGVEAELHIYPTGGHGYGMWKDEGTIATWPDALQNWLIATGVMVEQ